MMDFGKANQLLQTSLHSKQRSLHSSSYFYIQNGEPKLTGDLILNIQLKTFGLKTQKMLLPSIEI